MSAPSTFHRSRTRRSGWRRHPLGVCATALLAGLALAAGASSGARAGTSRPGARAGSAGRARASTSFTTVALSVLGGNDAPPFNEAHTLTVPARWSATVWARVSGVRFAAWSPWRPHHYLLVSASGDGQVVELIPARGASPPRKRVVASGLNGPQGLAFDTINGHRVLYVAEFDRIDRYAWNSSGLLGARRVIASNLPNLDPGGDDVHQAKSIAIGRDHTIYVTAGSGSNATPVPAGEAPQRASILSLRPDGSGLHVFASGVRNGEGLSIAPDGSLWTAVNERDEIPYPFHGAYGSDPEAFGKVISAYVDDHPPDELARLRAGQNLGWPYCDPDPDVTPGVAGSALRYGNLPFTPDAQTNPGSSVMNCAALPPLPRGLPAHSAPLGFHFLEGSAMPAPWSNGAVVAAHGSWDREPPRPPAVLWLPWEPGQRTLGESIALVSGFQLPSGERWGRPADAVPGPEGALYVTDDLAGAVYRIAPPGR